MRARWKKRRLPSLSGHRTTPGQAAAQIAAGSGPGGERWRPDGGVKIAALRLQVRNTRRHPAGNAGDRLSRDVGSGVGSLPAWGGLALLLWLRGPGSALAGACACSGSPPARLTRGVAGLASFRENTRESEGFDGTGAPMSRASSGFRAGSDPARCPRPALRAGRAPGIAQRAISRPARIPRNALRVAQTHSASGCDPTPSTREERGTRLAVASSRVRFTLGSRPGIEERAG